MKLEIDNLPGDNKGALVEALVSCRAEEFSDARLERFLRCEGMNTKVSTATHFHFSGMCLRTLYLMVSLSSFSISTTGSSLTLCLLLGVPSRGLWPIEIPIADDIELAPYATISRHWKLESIVFFLTGIYRVGSWCYSSHDEIRVKATVRRVW